MSIVVHWILISTSLSDCPIRMQLPHVYLSCILSWSGLALFVCLHFSLWSAIQMSVATQWWPWCLGLCSFIQILWYSYPTLTSCCLYFVQIYIDLFSSELVMKVKIINAVDRFSVLMNLWVWSKGLYLS